MSASPKKRKGLLRPMGIWSRAPLYNGPRAVQGFPAQRRVSIHFFQWPISDGSGIARFNAWGDAEALLAVRNTRG